MQLEAFRIDHNADIEIHKRDCADAKKLRKKLPAIECLAFTGRDWDSKEDFGSEWWDDINREIENESEPYTWQDEGIVWKPCTNSLRDWNEKMTETTATPEAKELPGKAPNEVPAPRSPKSRALPDGTCRCGCKKAVGRTSTFAQGHDARHISNLVAKVAKNEMTREAAIAEAASISPALEAKTIKNLDNVATQAAKSAAAKEAKEKKAAERTAALEEAKRLKIEAAKADVAKAKSAGTTADDQEPDVEVEDDDLDLESEDDDF